MVREGGYFVVTVQQDFLGAETEGLVTRFESRTSCRRFQGAVETLLATEDLTHRLDDLALGRRAHFLEHGQ